MKFEKYRHKNIIFDLGGVLLNLDYSLTTKAFQAIEPTFHSLDAIYSSASNKQLFEKYEKGLISSNDFRKGIKSILKNNKIADEKIDIAWNAMLLDMPKERLSLLEILKKDHHLFLLSNTNELHIDAYSAGLQQAYGFGDLSHIFIKEYYSYKIGLRKPDKDIFEHVLKENKLNANETFFIDDSLPHIKGANSIGIDARLLQKGETIVDVFNEIVIV